MSFDLLSIAAFDRRNWYIGVCGVDIAGHPNSFLLFVCKDGGYWDFDLFWWSAIRWRTRAALEEER